MDGRAFVVAAWEFNRNTATSVVFIEVFAFPIRNITLILKRRAKATCEAIPSARARVPETRAKALIGQEPVA